MTTKSTKKKTSEDKQTENKASKPKEIIFYAKENHGMAMGANSIREEQRAVGTGQILVPSGFITFDGGLYRTSDEAEIEHIRKSESYAINKIVEITEKEYESCTMKNTVITQMAAGGQG